MAMASTSNQYPGVNLPLRHMQLGGRAGVDYHRCGSFAGAAGSLSELIQVREVFMMNLMDRLTDTPNWREKVFDEAIVGDWRNEAVTQDEAGLYREIIAPKTYRPVRMPKRTRLVTEEAFDYCIAELRCKAAHFKATGLIFTLNSSKPSYGTANFNTVIKADSLVGDGLFQGLRQAFGELQAEQGDEPDWHPWTNEMVPDLVHPSMYPFIPGQTKFIQDEVVGVADAVDKWFGKGEAVPKPENPQPIAYADQNWEAGERIPREHWSQTCQWLPANLTFQEDGTVRFTSYINNLHPVKHAETYRPIEKLIDTVIPAWDRVLSGKAITASGQEQERLKYPPEVH